MPNETTTCGYCGAQLLPHLVHGCTGNRATASTEQDRNLDLLFRLQEMALTREGVEFTVMPNEFITRED